MAIPDRPLLAPWYRIVGDGDRLLLEHGQSVVALQGGAVRTFLPALLPLLDGTRTRDDLIARLGSPASRAVDLALETLTAHDLLVEGPDAPSEVRKTAHAIAAAFGVKPTLAAERLGGAVVGIVGASAAAADVARLLRLAGLANVRRIGWRKGAPVDLAVVAPAADEVYLLETWNRSAYAGGTRWIGLRPFDGRFAGIGPLVVPGESCCWECVVVRRAANLAFGTDLRDIEGAPMPARADASFELVAVALAAH